jgi:hypothetical protein
MVSGVTAPLSVAAATVDVTPPAGTPLGGYLQREGKPSTGAHDALEATLLWLRDGAGGEVVWVAIDALMVDQELARQISAAVSDACGCAADAVLVCASHTHSSAGGWVRGLGPMLADSADDRLRKALVDGLAEGARSLPALREACWPVVAEGHSSSLGGNRNDPGGPHDDSIGILALVDTAGRVAAAAIDYASHATVLGYQNLAWSADWPGAARHSLAGALQGMRPFGPADASEPAREQPRRPDIAFLQGAAGDASPRFARRSQSFGEADRLGALVGAGALEALLDATLTIDEDERQVAVRRGSVRVQTRELPTVEDARRRSAQLEAAWQAARSAGVAAPQERIARTRYEGSLMLAALAEAGIPPQVDLPIAAIQVGRAAWVHLPVELFASFGLAIRKRSPFRWTRVIGYTDGYFGYVADEAAHRDGVYEAFASWFDPSGGEIIADAAVDLLAALPAAAAAERSKTLEGAAR